MNSDRGFVRVLGITIALACVLAAGTVRGDSRTDYLARLLQSSSQFRVRVQAAISLGRVEPQAPVVSALSEALSDQHPAVRAAAASSLERLGDPTAIAALTRHGNDPQEDVRAAVNSAIAALQATRNVRPSVPAVTAAAVALPTPGPGPSPGTGVYYVGIGLPGTRASGLDESVLREAREFLRARIAEVEGVVLAPDAESARQADAVLRSRRLTGYFIDSSVVSVEARADGAVRATVSVIVGTYPGRDMRSILQGAATVMGGGASAQSQAIQGAFSGALRNLGQAMAAGRR